MNQFYLKIRGMEYKGIRNNFTPIPYTFMPYTFEI